MSSAAQRQIATAIEDILTRRVITCRMDGYTLEASKEVAEAVISLLQQNTAPDDGAFASTIGERVLDNTSSVLPEGRSEQDQGGETERTLAEYRKSLDLSEAACRALDADLSAARLRTKALETTMRAVHAHLCASGWSLAGVCQDAIEIALGEKAPLLSAQGETKPAPRCERCAGTGIWPTADGVGHYCQCGAAPTKPADQPIGEG